MARDDRRLSVFFSAGATRYALDAVRVREVVRLGAGPGLPLDEALAQKDLSHLLGGDDEPEVGAGVVLDVTPPLALRVKQVDGVFDCAQWPRWKIHGRLIRLLAPAVVSAVEHEGKLVFELDAEGASRGLPRQLKPLERHLREDTGGLVFFVQGERLAVPLSSVVQVIEATNAFNRAPNAGSFLGAAVHRGQLCPVFTVGPLGLVQPYIVLFEAGGELLGLSASQVEGVRVGPALGGAPILDVGRMFS